MGQMFFATDFPNRSNDFHILTDKFLAHCAGKSFVHKYIFHIIIIKYDTYISHSFIYYRH